MTLDFSALADYGLLGLAVLGLGWLAWRQYTTAEADAEKDHAELVACRSGLAASRERNERLRAQMILQEVMMRAAGLEPPPRPEGE